MNALTLSSPAKLNLFLKVNFKRPDGFHDITTVFERINLHDDIFFRATSSPEIRITCDAPDVPTGPKNLIFRVGRILQTQYDVRQGVRVHIKKQIPVAAGMAGGSSNAATALLGLNQLWKLGLKREELAGIAKRVGSDVAFFLYETSWAIGTERGDRIKPLPIRSTLWHVAVTPKLKIYSGEIYQALKLGLTKKKGDVKLLLHYLKKYNILQLCSFLLNDLEEPIFRLFPSLHTLEKKLNMLGAKGVMVSGSGPSIFGLAESEADAKKIANVLGRRYSRVFVVKTL
jgi:4-diphosphocytidyl-2-C-methyl-D-erythritol kinase